jgi:hypothetical protein
MNWQRKSTLDMVVLSCACHACRVLSHGGDGYIFGSDGKKVLIENEKKKLKKRETLDGKPKIWIIQACQGDELQENQENQQPSILKQIFDLYLFGYRTLSYSLRILFPSFASSVTNRHIAGSDSNTQESQIIPAQNNSDIPRPPMSDFLDIRATIPGFASFRNAGKGIKCMGNELHF